MLAKRSLQAIGLIAAGIGVAQLMFMIGDYSENHWLPPERWWVFAAFTVFTLAYIVTVFRGHWHLWSYWLLVLLFLLTHVVGISILLYNVSDWPLPFFMAMTSAEIMGIAFIMAKLGFRETLAKPESSPRPMPTRRARIGRSKSG